MLLMKGGSSILIHYGNSFAKALIDLYPNIGLDSSKFTSVPRTLFIILIIIDYYTFNRIILYLFTLL